MATKKYLSRFFTRSNPLREIIKVLFRKLELGSYKTRLSLGAMDRPHYAYCIYHAANLAIKLGYDRMSVLELGVAGGMGLLNIESHVEKISKLFSINIDIYGFDTGKGLPEPVDYRDLPYVFKEKFFTMDVEKLEARLKKAKLILGDIEETGRSFFKEYDPAPIGAILYDLDFYSSTVSALRMLDADEKYYLPRVFCYFDDVHGSVFDLYNDYSGERLAINEFNQLNKYKKLALPYHLYSFHIVEPWYNKIWIFHNFRHSKYSDFIDQNDK